MDIKSQTSAPRFLSAMAGAVVLAFGATPANSAEIKVVSGPEMAQVLTVLAPKFERLTKHTLVIERVAQSALNRQLDAEPFDVALVSLPTAGRLLERGKVTSDGLSSIAWSQLGIAVRAGAATPDVGTPDNLRRTLLAARSIAFSGDDASGLYFRNALVQLGIADQVEAKLADTGNDKPLERVARGDAELGVTLTSEIASFAGVVALGPLPFETQTFKPVFAALSTDANSPAAAKRLIAFLSSFDAAKAIHANGMETHLAE